MCVLLGNDHSSWEKLVLEGSWGNGRKHTAQNELTPNSVEAVGSKDRLPGVLGGRCFPSTLDMPWWCCGTVDSRGSGKAPPVAQMVKKLPAIQESWVLSLGQEDSLEKGMATHPVFLPGESHGQRSLAGYSPWGHKESDKTERLTLSLSRFWEEAPQAQRGNKTNGQASWAHKVPGNRGEALISPAAALCQLSNQCHLHEGGETVSST